MKADQEIGQSSRRDENSLYSLTKKFIILVYNSPEQHVNMTHAAQMLQVSKRRMYDITNVLESLGMVYKWSVNEVKWIGGNVDDILAPENRAKDDEEILIKTSKKEMYLDQEIEDLNNAITELSSNQKNLENAYVTYDDLKNLNIFENKLVFAVKAPSDDTIIEYPRYQKGAYRLRIMADKGQISVYYVNDGDES